MPISLITCGAGVGPCAGARAAGGEGGDRQDWHRISGKLRRKSMPVLSVLRLHEDEAQFGGGLEDYRLGAGGPGGFVDPGHKDRYRAMIQQCKSGKAGTLLRTAGRSNDEMRIQDDAAGRPLWFGQAVQKKPGCRDAYIPCRLSDGSQGWLQ